jgi:hypothetical protein
LFPRLFLVEEFAFVTLAGAGNSGPKTQTENDNGKKKETAAGDTSRNRQYSA